MTTQTVQTAGIAAMPSVNLMPPEIADAARFRQLQVAMGGAVVLSAVMIGGLYMHGKGSVTTAQTQLATAQSQQASLQTTLNSLSSVSTTYASIQAKQTLLQQAMGGEIRWSYLLNDLSFRIPNNVWLTNVSATEGTSSSPTSTTTLTPATGSATAPVEVGTVTFSGVGRRHNDVAAWLDALAKERGLDDPTFTNSTEAEIGSEAVVNFGSTANIDSDALSLRFVAKAGN